MSLSCVVEYARDTWVHMGCPRQPQLPCPSELQLLFDANEPLMVSWHPLVPFGLSERVGCLEGPFLHVLPALPEPTAAGVQRLVIFPADELALALLAGCQGKQGACRASCMPYPIRLNKLLLDTSALTNATWGLSCTCMAFLSRAPRR